MDSRARSVAMWLLLALVSLVATAWGDVIPGGVLYPRDSETREVRSLDGIWNFRASDDPLEGFSNKWFNEDLAQTGDVIPMPVPASYNDITQDKSLRDHFGLVWYDRTFYVPNSWYQNKNRIWLRFGSVNYAAQLWVNGLNVGSHEIGHLPFQFEITSAVKFGEKNRLTVVVDNTLIEATIPQGSIGQVYTYNGTTIKTQSYSFDFFNYAGIHRSVHLYTTPVIFIDDITVQTDVDDNGTALITYNITYGGNIEPASEPLAYVELVDHNGTVVVTDDGVGNLSGILTVSDPKLWWPYLMDPNPGYMYTLKVRLQSKEWGSEDIYRQPIGIRTLAWNNTSFLINGKPIYIRGFGRHEDSDIRGKGLDLPLVVRDYNLLKWIGANAYRTSHYPYAEEIMDMADQQGIMIIDECPSVDTDIFSNALLLKHVDSLQELIRRDKNRPSVIMWSVANEPRVEKAASESYFSYVADFVRSLDLSRPISMATARYVSEDKAAQFMDIIMFNRYYAWYSSPGKLMIIRKNIETDAQNWHKKFNKPIMISEYGADTMVGLHLAPSYIWSEEYQDDLLAEHFKAFDTLRQKGFFVGEMIWNFADFKTAETYTRVGGNRKGVFTRNRQPKRAAYLVRKRYFALAAELDGVQEPDNLDNYVASTVNIRDKTEL